MNQSVLEIKTLKNCLLFSSTIQYEILLEGIPNAMIIVVGDGHHEQVPI